MKLSSTLTSLLFLLPLLSRVSGASLPVLAARQDRNDRNGGGNDDGGNNDGDNNDGGDNDGGNNNGDPQTSLTLDDKVIADGFKSDGQGANADPGQVASLTSSNNYINFCLTVPDLPITNGKQIPTGSCNPAPMGILPSSDNMPSSKFTNPKNGDNIEADQAFTITMAVRNFATGNFVNAQENYFSAPQQLNNNGDILGHSHVVVEALDSLDQTTPTDPKKFAFFKGLNEAAEGGELKADVANGLPAGAYRLCSINTAANHQPAVVPIAQHGSLDDCVYFTAGAGGGGNDDNADDNADDNGDDNADDNADNNGDDNADPADDNAGDNADPADNNADDNADPADDNADDADPADNNNDRNRDRDRNRRR